jgi:DNA-binding CsgD family transcriptional regulator
VDAFEVYVPVVLDGSVVGAYEVYQDLSLIRSLRPALWALVAGAFGVLFHLAVRLTVSQRQLRAEPSPGQQPVSPPEPASVSRGPRLTPREREVLQLLGQSRTYRDIAAQLGVSEETVRSHVKRILHKLGQPHRAAAVVVALQTGLIDLPDHDRDCLTP